MRCQMWLWRIDNLSVLKLINWLWIVIVRKWFLTLKFKYFSVLNSTFKELSCLPVLYLKVFPEHYIASKCRCFLGYLHCCLQNWLPKHNVLLKLRCLSNLWHVWSFSKRKIQIFIHFRFSFIMMYFYLHLQFYDSKIQQLYLPFPPDCSNKQ